MAQGTFPQCMRYVFEEEGGYADNPADPGGPTNMGITLRTLSAWRGHAVSPDDVKNLGKAEATQIYKVEYWNKIDGDELPAGLDYAVFDFAVNSGPARAAIMLQEIIGVPQDGVIGMQTIRAAESRNVADVINALCDKRQAWLQTLMAADTFGTGWTSRVERVRSRALALAAENKDSPAANGAGSATAKARQSDTSVTSILAKPEALGSLGSVATGLAAIATGRGPVQYALAAVMIMFALVGVWYFIRRIRGEP
ncbi:acetylmuramidase [Paramesorhizobium deserti]|uniref:Acetylmuramidase n=1 Tax=Paramesorhizobium deserti TaxID=1494590 RepID=A0A135HQ83_9HYPH|nr:glycoside hydrolase family 108 protein [Paramesorhizobium deserti]KXF75346.1 acetylmuramidase [Paramesorhizobium deserti]